MLWEAVRLALRAIRRNMLRSFLTVLGVVIGVSAVIAMVTVGQGSSAQVSADVASLGSNALVLRPGKAAMGPPGGGDDSPEFTLRDVDALRGLSVVAAAAPSASTSVTVVAGNVNVSTTATGIDAGYFEVRDWPLVLGRSFTEAEEKGGAAVCILGETMRQTLFGNIDPIGEQIRLKSLSCEVIGLLEAKGASSFGTDQDDLILLPIRTFQRRIAGNTDVAGISISMAGGVTTKHAISEIETLMRERRRISETEDDDFTVTDMKQMSNVLAGISNVLTGLLSSVAAVSLLVGGIGIMNIMLVSVTERTREIGIRLAVGAEARQVLTQFLVEAVVLSVIGGVLGIMLGLAFAAVGSSYMNIAFAPDYRVVLAAFAFSAVVGVIFGFFPARRAARLDPIEALRYQ